MSVNGYAGKILRVDLTNERLSEETLDEATLRKWVGGVGLGAKYLYEEVPPGVEWDDPENCLIVATGPLGGTRAGGSGTISISAKGPLTNGASSTQANGYMGAYMKFAGYDAIVIKGAAKRWVYLYMHDGQAELRDAAQLVGKDTWETEDAVKAELGYKDTGMSVFCIGPAGENLVKFAGIFGDKDHAAGHNGVGAVMGAKKLKAFCAARGRARLEVNNSAAVTKNTNAIWDMLKDNPMGRRIFTWGTGGDYESSQTRMKAGTLPIKNYTTSFYPETGLMTSEHSRGQWSAKWSPCWACQQHHCHMITFTDGPYAGQTVEEPEYEMYAAWGPLVGNTDPAETLFLANLNTRLGFESNESGFLLSMVIELYEKGELSREITEGLELNWGSTGAMRTLMERIARREGAFANILAEGTMRAAEALGPSAVQCGIFAKKGHSPRGHDHRAMWREMFDTATSDIGTYQAGYMGPADTEETGIPPIVNIFSPEEVSTNVAKSKGRRQFEDVLGTCTFCTRVPLRNLLTTLNAVTGWDFTIDEAQAVGFRAANLMRVFNLRHGLTVDLEQPSVRWSSTPIDGPAEGISIRPYWEQMLDNYYQQMGWDRQTGRPYPATLQELGLGELIPVIWESEAAKSQT